MGFSIAAKQVASHRPYVLAEIGQNHNGCPHGAMRLMKASHEAGCQGVKFTKRTPKKDLTPKCYSEPYDSRHSYGTTYGEHREYLEFTGEQMRLLRDRIKYNEWDLDFVVTICDRWALEEVLRSFEPDAIKIASRDLSNYKLLHEVAQVGLPLIISTGMHDYEDAIAARDIVTSANQNYLFLHCVSAYPCPFGTSGLGRLQTLRDALGVDEIGFSDHTTGVVAACLAVSLGACLIEKHITMSKKDKGTDHRCSIKSDALAQWVDMVKSTNLATASFKGRENEARNKLGRAVCARASINPGDMVSDSDIEFRSPQSHGIPAKYCKRMVGRVATCKISEGEPITFENTVAQAVWLVRQNESCPT